MNHSDWYSVYTTALLEIDPAKLPTRIHEAQTAIFLRLQNLSEDSESCHERETIAYALSSLNTLQRSPQRYVDLMQVEHSSSNGK
jgi:hypothetical protein